MRRSLTCCSTSNFASLDQLNSGILEFYRLVWRKEFMGDNNKMPSENDDGKLRISELTNDQRRKSRILSIYKFGSISGIVVSLSFIVSFFYNWGFFVALEIPLSEVLITNSDLIQSWLLWLPFVIIASALLLTYDLFITRVERGMTEEEIIANSSHPRFFGWFRKSPYVFIAIFSFLGFILWVLFGEIFHGGLIFGAPIIWFIFVGWSLNHIAMNNRFSEFTKSLIFWVPPVMFISFFWGFHLADSTRVVPSMSHRLVVDITDSKTETIHVELVRAFEVWLLVRDEDWQLSWLRLDRVRRIEPLERTSRFQGLACMFSSRWCLLQSSVE